MPTADMGVLSCQITFFIIPIPGIWMLLAKAILNLDGIIRLLSPRLDPVDLIREFMLEVI